ncbi:MAG: hypothetical protein J6Y72_00780 [Bacteroidales bacterium]|nr:hypothetical protein [Bacteroidales bacterium]
MKALRSIVTAAAFIASLCASAQNSEPDIMQRETFTDKIQKCRNLVYENTLDAHDTTAVRELLTYAQTTLETGSNIAFSLDEYRVLYLINGFYKDLIVNIKATNDSTYYAESRGKSQHRFDNFFYRAMNYVYDHKDDIISSVSINSTISKSDKSFLILYINYITTSDRNDINDLCDEYLSTEPEKSYETFTRKYMRYKYEPYQKFGFYLGFGLGAKVNSQSLSDIFVAAPEGEIVLGLSYERFVFQFSAGIYSGDAREDLENGGTILERGKTCSIGTPQLFAGYKIPLKRSWNLLPSVGIQRSSIEDSPSNKQDDIDFKCKGVWKPGVALELSREWGQFLSITNGKISYYYWQLGIRYAILPTAFHMQSGTYSGVAHCIDITVGLGYSRAKRAY